MCVMAQRSINPVADILVAIVLHGKKDYVKNTTHNILQGLSAAVFTDYWLVIFNLTREIQYLPKTDNHQAASNKTLQ